MESIRIRHGQIIFREQRDLRAIQVGEVKVRIGDLVALMICAQYKAVIEKCYIYFQLMDPVHISLKADLLFQGVIDEILTEEGPDYGMLGPDRIDIYDPGLLWMASTHYYEKYGTKVLPTLYLNQKNYTGPELDWGKYVVFHPLFDPMYNTPRGMSESFVDQFCRQLLEEFGNRALVVTDQPNRISVPIRRIVFDNLYDLVYVAANAKVFIGGDTGFTHYAALRVPHLLCLYGENYCTSYTASMAELCTGDLWYPFASFGNFWGTNFDTRPKYNPRNTECHFYVLQDNQLTRDDYNAVIRKLKTIV